MAVTRETLQLSRELRLIVSALANDATRNLVKAWALSWREISGEFKAAIAELLEVGGGQWPSRSQLARATRAQHALDLAVQEIGRLSELTGVLVVHAGGESLAQAAEWQPRLIASQLPPSQGPAALAAGVFDRVSEDAIGAMVERFTEQITARTIPLSVAAEDAVRRSLIRGVSVGENPKVTGRAMLKRVEGAFNGGLTRALTIARTEILDAHRSGAAAGQMANSDVVRGWAWQAQLDSRTCASCWAMHGSEHDLSETGPNDHQNGRCSRTPLTKTWAQLGFSIPEPASVLPNAETVFHALPEATQLKIMGPGRLEAIHAGTPWQGLAMLRSNPGWRPSVVPAPVYALRRRFLHVAR